MKYFAVVILIILSLTGCNKPDPTPEKNDPIYQDLNAQVAAVSQQLEAEKKTLEGHQQALRDVIPQTGQIKYARKRVYEAEERIVKLTQRQAYLKLKVKARAKEARISYLRAFKNGENWPEPAEWESYQAEKRLLHAKRTWDAKQRIDQMSQERAPAAAAGSEH